MRAARLVLLTSIATCATAAPVTFTLALHDEAAVPATAASIGLHRVTNKAELNNPATVHIELAPGATQTIDLAPGAWAADVDMPAHWHARQFVMAGNEPSHVTLHVWPASTITGTASLNDGTPLRDLYGHIVSAALETDVVCTTHENTFQCSVPAGTYDLRLRAPEHIARYFKAVACPVGGEAKLPAVTFERGASIVGNVSIGKGVKTSLESVALTAAPAGTGRLNGMQVLTTTADAHGFFHFDGLAPGQYVLRAHAPGGAASRDVAVNVLAYKEANLAMPIRVDRPAHIAAVIDPPLDPALRPWHIRVTESSSATTFDVAADSYADSNGLWTSSPLHGGKYTVYAGPHDGGEWYVEPVTIDGDAPVLHVSLQAHAVTGTIRIGERPLAAELEFASEHVPAVRVRSDDNGEFTASLPHSAALWSVRVKSDAPPLRRVLKNVDIRQSPVRLAIPMTVVTGTVKNANGSDIGQAMVNVSVHGTAGDYEPAVQVPVEPDGTFAVYGLRPGEYRIQAVAFLQESVTQPLTVSDTPGDPLTLVMREQQQVRGRVQSRSGHGIPGAQLLVLATDVPMMLSGFENTDMNGDFAAEAPPGAHELDVCVFAPGFGAKIAHAHFDGRPLTVFVDEAAGLLTVPAPHDDRWPYLRHLGAIVPATFLTNESESAEQLTIAGVDPGAYDVCMLTEAEFRGAVPADRCTSGFLPPYGALTLTAAR